MNRIQKYSSSIVSNKVYSKGTHPYRTGYTTTCFVLVLLSSLSSPANKCSGQLLKGCF